MGKLIDLNLIRIRNSKRGFLLAEEALKLILAVISIGILAYLLYSLYNANSNSKELEAAEASLSRVVEEINSNATEIQVYNPEGWIFSSWFGLSIPETYGNLGWESAICLCEEDTSVSCKSGACMENSQNLRIANGIKIDNPPVTLTLNYQTKEVSKA